MLVPVIVLATVYVASLGLLLWVAHRNKALYAAAKGVSSGLFLACLLLCWFGGRQADTFAFGFMLGAMLLCAFGDVLLGVANRTAGHVSKKPFVAGAGCFTLAHVLFCALFAGRSPFHWYDLAASVLLLGVLWLLERRDAVRLKRMRPLGYVYTFMVGLMAWKALESALWDGRLGLDEGFLAGGALLFFLSDVVLMFLYFGTRRRRWYRPANLLTYYAGVFLMAVSALWL